MTERASGLRLVCTANVDHIVNLRRSPLFRSAYEQAYLRTIDGAPVHLYSQVRGIGVPERVTGSDLFPLLMDRLIPLVHRPAFIVSNITVAGAIRDFLVRRGFEPNAFVTIVPPFGFETSISDSQAITQRLAPLQCTHLFLGVGSPKSELWITQHGNLVGDTYAFGFGAAIDYFADTAKRAPQLLRKLGFEWLWRLASEPRRLYRRYLLDSWTFLLAVLDDLAARRTE